MNQSNTPARGNGYRRPSEGAFPIVNQGIHQSKASPLYDFPL